MKYTCNCGSSNDKHAFSCDLFETGGGSTNRIVSGIMLSKKDVEIFKTRLCAKCGAELPLLRYMAIKYCNKCKRKKVY